jgi:uncharacterized protein YbjT (DUF2867 family)
MPARRPPAPPVNRGEDGKMADRKTLVVVGATGAQGGGLARAVAADKTSPFAARGVTRKLDSDKAKALTSQGVQMVAADLDDEKSLEKAFAGASAAFCVTNYWEHFSPDRELRQARNLAKAAKAAALEHVIWSTLEDTRKWVPLSDNRMPTLMGSYKVPHFDAKGEADQIFKDTGVPTTCLLTSFYWENLIYFGAGPKPDPDGTLTLTYNLDDKKMPSIAVEDIGKCAYAIFKRGDEFIGKTIGIAGEHLSGAEMAVGLSKALGREVRYKAVTSEVYRSLGFPGADDLGNMFQFKRDFNDYYRGARDLGFSRSLNPTLQTYDQWLAKHAREIPLT